MLRQLATLVPRRHRQSEQDFILDQRQHIEVGNGLDGIALVVFQFILGDFVSGAHQQQRRHKLERPRHRRQAALADELQLPADGKFELQLAVGTTSAAHGKLQRVVVGTCVFSQTRKRNELSLAFDLTTVGSKAKRIGEDAALRHKPAMILFPDSCVKTELCNPAAFDHRSTTLCMSASPPLVLASTSVYRRELLERLGLPFRCVAPEVDEAPLTGETPAALAARLALAKARAGLQRTPGALCIGSDQTACGPDGELFGKPGTVERAIAQLERLSGTSATFHTALALVDGRHADAPAQQRTVVTTVRFRSLTRTEIERYVAREPALDCAGAAKIEGLGISLLEELAGPDPTALIGLPLIALGDMLRKAGLALP